MPLVLSADCGQDTFLLRTFSTRRPFGRFLANSLGIQAVHTWLGCVLAATVIAFPLMYRNARAAFEQVDENVIYAAQTLWIERADDLLEDPHTDGKTGHFIRYSLGICKGDR